MACTPDCEIAVRSNIIWLYICSRTTNTWCQAVDWTLEFQIHPPVFGQPGWLMDLCHVATERADASLASVVPWLLHCTCPISYPGWQSQTKKGGDIWGFNPFLHFMMPDSCFSWAFYVVKTCWTRCQFHNVLLQSRACSTLAELSLSTAKG